MPKPNAKRYRVQDKSSNVRFKQLLSAQADTLVKVMENIVAPGEGEPQVFPGHASSRCGSARYRLGTTVKAQEGFTDFGIECTPSLISPLKISSIKPEQTLSNSDPLQVRLHTAAAKAADLEAKATFEGVVSTIASETRYSKMAIPIKYSINSPAVTAKVTLVHYDGYLPGTFKIMMFNDGVAQELGSASMSLSSNVATMALTPLAGASQRFLFFEFSAAGAAEFHIELTPTVGLHVIAASQGRLTSFVPDWADHISDSSRVRIVAMDALVTYHGPTLVNGGSIAAANVDSSIPLVAGADGDCSYYDTVVQRPFDRYAGKLASSGETEGGAHWVYYPDSLEQLLLESPEKVTNHDVPTGLIGIAGMTPEGVFRVEMNIILNFYSELPKYHMMIQPSMELFELALSLTRKNIDVVSSNDSHVNKLKKVGKSAFSGASKLASSGIQFIKDNPELVAGHALELLI